LAAGLGLIAYALYLGETKNLTVFACVWQFPLIAVDMAALLVSVVSPRLPLCRVAIPGASFIASIAYSAYLIQKLVINGVEQFCTNHNIDLTSVPALLGVELCVYAAATLLFFGSRTTISPIASPNRSTEFTRRGGRTPRATKVASLFFRLPFDFLLLPFLQLRHRIAR
jgi:peptidoglycan/LPS O-acetylase OafA/YrhL